MEPLRLFVSVPIAGFRIAQAREYWETYPCPPPATVYGMLLSAVGEEERSRHAGAEIAVAMLSAPATSTVLRTLWRVKKANGDLGTGENKRPDYQELLTDVRVCVWLRSSGREQRHPPLVDRVREALASPATITRYGGLSLGESTCLVDEIRAWRNGDAVAGRILHPDDRGDLSLPIWPDHVGSAGTRWGQYRLGEMNPLPGVPADGDWTMMNPLE